MSIVITNLSKSFDNKTVLRDFSCEFSSGIYCVMGRSGGGKTTLINILLGLIPPDSGSISGTEGKRVSVVFQEDRLCENINAVKNVMLVAGQGAEKQTAIDLLSSLGLEGSLSKPVSKLSGGMKRRVAIARALLNEADIYLLDEPLKGLDDDIRAQVTQIIKQRTAGAITLIVTHDKADIAAFGAIAVNLGKGESE